MNTNLAIFQIDVGAKLPERKIAETRTKTRPATASPYAPPPPHTASQSAAEYDRTACAYHYHNPHISTPLIPLETKQDALRTLLLRIIYRVPELLAPEDEQLRLLLDVLLVAPRGVDLDGHFVGAQPADDGADARLEEGLALRDHEDLHRFGEDGVAAAVGSGLVRVLGGMGMGMGMGAYNRIPCAISMSNDISFCYASNTRR